MNSDYIDVLGSFTLKFGNEKPIKYVIGDNINKNAEIIEHVILNKAGSTFRINDELVTIVDKNVTVDSKKIRLNNFIGRFIESLKKYGGQGFIHATSFDNLASIYNKKYLYSRNKCFQNGIFFKSYAEKEVLKITDSYVKNSVRFYFRPKNQPLYDFYKKNQRICILVFDYRLLFDTKAGQIEDRIVTSPNKNVYYLNDESDMQRLNRYFNYEKTFYRNYVDKIQNHEIWDCKCAELLIYDCVSINYIKEIVFPNKLLYNEFKRLFPYWNVNVSVKPDFF